MTMCGVAYEQLVQYGCRIKGKRENSERENEAGYV